MNNLVKKLFDVKKDSLDHYYANIAVAAVDICGMKVLVNKGDYCVSAMKALENLVMNASTSMAYAELPNKPPALKMYEIGHYFGDSVYFFPDPVQPIKEQIDLLSTKCAALIATGFHVGFLVRVGIAVGDLRIKQITLPEGEKREIKIGSSMAKAHTLQDLQDWVGGAVLSEFPAALPEINRLKYEVPLKDSGYSFPLLWKP